MPLKNVGEVCILDFNEIAHIAFLELKQYDNKLTSADRRTVEDVVGQMLDNYITQNMWWTKHRASTEPAVYLRQLPIAIEKHNAPYELIARLLDKVSVLLMTGITLPTWNVLDVRIKGSLISIEMDEDYRITDWMEKNGREYDVEGQKRSW